MLGWTTVVDLVRATLFWLAHIFGGSLGTAILTLSLMVRLAFLPWTLRLAVKGRAMAERMKALAPQIEALKARHAQNPTKLSEATFALYREHDVGFLPPGTAKTLLIQAPVSIALSQAVASGAQRAAAFLWIGNLARPDVAIAAAAAILAGVAARVLPESSGGTRTAAIVSATITLAVAWRMSAAMGLYWTASNAVGVGQSLLLRRPVSRSQSPTPAPDSHFRERS